MNRLRVCILFFAFAVIAARAEQTNTPAPASATNNAAPSAVTSNALPDTITIGGVTYSNVTWRSVTPATVTIFHSTGIAAIPLWKLPPELQKRFGYDPQKATAYLSAEQERDKAQQQLLKYRADTRLLLDGRLVEASYVQKVDGTIVATPASVKADDGQTYTGTILEGAKVVGYDITTIPNPAGGGEGSAEEGSVDAYRARAAYMSGGDYTFASPQFAAENFFVKDFFPSNKIGTSVSFQGARINPVGRYTAWAVARKPSFEEWQKLQK